MYSVHPSIYHSQIGLFDRIENAKYNLKSIKQKKLLQQTCKCKKFS